MFAGCSLLNNLHKLDAAPELCEILFVAQRWARDGIVLQGHGRGTAASPRAKTIEVQFALALDANFRPQLGGRRQSHALDANLSAKVVSRSQSRA